MIHPFLKFILYDDQVLSTDYDLTFFRTKTLKSSYHQRKSPIPNLKDKLDANGFTILETLVTILVTATFLLGSLQATVLATLLRVQAQNKQEISNWIQQDLELIKYNAFILPSNSNHCGNYGDILKKHLDGSTSGKFLSQESIFIPDHNPKAYDITRQYHASENTLKITYIVTYGIKHPNHNDSGNNQITTFLTEVIPNAALNCSF